MANVDLRKCILGFDPGLTGAWALLDQSGELVEVGDLPVTDRGIDVIALDLTLAGFVDTYAWGDASIGVRRAALEWPQVMPCNGAKSAYSMGLTLGRIETVLLLSGVGVERVDPNRWKRVIGLNKADKTASRAMATRLWPTFADQFKRVKDDGRAEAALIARWLVQGGK